MKPASVCALSWTIKEKLCNVNWPARRQLPSRLNQQMWFKKLLTSWGKTVETSKSKQVSNRKTRPRAVTPTPPRHMNTQFLTTDCRVTLIGQLGDVLTACSSRSH